MLIGLARTSTTDQEAGLNAQLTALKAAGCEKLFVEQVSAIGPRPQREAAIDFAREGDTLVVTALSRLARSVADLMAIIKRLEDKGVNLRILDFGGSSIDTKGPTGKLILTLVGAIAEFERSLMLERQLAGIAKAKADGKYKGRVPTARRQEADIVRLRQEGKSPEAIAEALEINRSSVFRVLKDNGLTNISRTNISRPMMSSGLERGMSRSFGGGIDTTRLRETPTALDELDDTPKREE
jgi:DNA invertase Pin-like site-specific DNA recombinase